MMAERISKDVNRFFSLLHVARAARDQALRPNNQIPPVILNLKRDSAMNGHHIHKERVDEAAEIGRRHAQQQTE